MREDFNKLVYYVLNYKDRGCLLLTQRIVPSVADAGVGVAIAVPVACPHLLGG